jgi:hypothetical protein
MAAVAARAVGLSSNRTTGTTPVPVLGECGNKNGMHKSLHSTRSVRQDGGDLRLCIAQCVGVSGRGYYATGPQPDVLGRLLQAEAVLRVPVGYVSTPDKRLPAPLNRYPSSRRSLCSAR